ncbi:DUF1963 domain-containing protein [Leptodesmis sp.]|uniref:DUF1963 domain-containing protein n=1 Tax=Leptodesmis sp. TaxID=3100501 RepID=UPI0040534E2A
MQISSPTLVFPPFEHPIVPKRLSLRFQIKLAPMDAGGLTTWVEALKTSEFFAENYDYALRELRDRASNDPVLDAALSLLAGDGHRLGGYPAFSQADPRAQLFPLAFSENFPPYELLFRMVGQPGVELHDAIFYFLIQPSDLQSRDFSNANCSGYTQPSSPSPFSLFGRRGTCPVQSLSPCLGEGFRVRADRVVTSNVLFYSDR